jgi:hypothetical protein
MKTRRVVHKKTKKAYTKRAKVQAKTLSIPQLRRAFESVETYARRGPSTQQFMKHWKRVFGKILSEKSAKEYLSFMSKQRGGDLTEVGQTTTARQALRGGLAPINHDLRPGSYSTPDGAYQEYISGGFEVSVPEPARLGECKTGGKRRSLRGGVMPNPAAAAAAFISHPYAAQNPPTYAHLATKDFYGDPYHLPADVTKSPPNYLPMGTNAIAPVGMTKLNNDVSTLMGYSSRPN